MDLSTEEGVRFFKNASCHSKDAIEITKEEYLAIMSQYPEERNVEYTLTTETILKYIK